MAILTRKNVDALIERDQIKARLKALDQELKPVIAQAVKEAGDGAQIRVGEHVIAVSLMPHTTVSWKTIAELVGTADEINAVMEDCRETTSHPQAKVIR